MVDFGGVALKYVINRCSSSKRSVSRKKFKGWVAIKEGKRGRFMYFIFLFCVAPFVAGFWKCTDKIREIQEMDRDIGWLWSVGSMKL